MRSQTILITVLILLSFDGYAQLVGCCDESSADYFPNPASNCPNDVAWNPSDGVTCDPDCTDDYDPCVQGSECYDSNAPQCATIPIDGGLSLLALAGGGLATAAMRRRREEEAAQEAV